MKSQFISLLLLLFVITSCKKETPAEKTSSYPAIIVGTHKNGVYTVENQDIVKQEWEKQLRAAGITSEIGSFKIDVLKIEGDGQTVGSTSYLGLTAVTKDGKSSLCALLDPQDGGRYYFNQDTPAIICSGTCQHGCNPSGLLKNGNFFLVCSECSDCVKTEFILNFP